MIEFSQLENLGFELYGGNVPKSGFLMYRNQQVGHYDGLNGGKVTTNQGISISLEEAINYVTALEVLMKSNIPFTGSDFNQVILDLKEMRRGINALESRVQRLQQPIAQAQKE
jgi:hypothetical protein